MRSLTVAMVLGSAFVAFGCSSNNGGTRLSDSSSGPQTAGPKYATDIAVTEIAVFQGTKVDVVATDANGNTASVQRPNAPLIPGRAAQIRAYLQTGDNYQPHAINATLHIADANGTDLFVLRDKKSVDLSKSNGSSTDADLGTTFNFLLEQDKTLPAQATYLVELLDPDSGQALAVTPDGGSPATTQARWPQDGSYDTLPIKSDGASIKVLFVPVEYDADGSGRLPDTSDAQIKSFTDRLMQLYPVAKVDYTIHAPFPWKQHIEADGTGWQELAMGLAEMRAQENIQSNVYVAALFDNYATWDAYFSSPAASQGAILGIGFPDGASDPSFRTALVVGYTGVFSGGGQTASAFDTLPQELAHCMGRMHAPCAPAGQTIQAVDPKYPYPQGKIGQWGYDVLSRTFIDPGNAKVREYMSYCFDSIWTSDYTFNAVAKELTFVNGAVKSEVRFDTPRPYRMLQLDANGKLTDVRTVHRRTAPPTDGVRVPVSFLTASGATVSSTEGRILEMDAQLKGVRLIEVPEPEGYDAINVHGIGRVAKRATVLR